MLEVEKWGLDKKSLGGVMFAQRVVTSAEAVIELYLSVQADNGSLPFAEGESHTKERLTFYRNHWAVIRAVADVLGFPVDGFQEFAREFFKLQANPTGMGEAISQVSREDWQGVTEAVQAIYKDHIASIEHVESDDWAIDFSPVVDSPELSFFFYVLMPCWLEYGETPWHLFWRASRQKPDIDALEKLITIDKVVASHPMLQSAVNTADPTQRVARRELLAAATLKSKLEITRKKAPQAIKVRLASLISLVSELLCDRQTSTQIRALFDAHARDQGKVSDFDLPTSNEALQKAIRRGRDHWYLPEPDKETAKHVRALREVFS